MADLWQSPVWTRLRRQPAFYVASVLILMLVAMAIAPGLFAERDPGQCDLAFSRGAPQGGAPFGYNVQGCDLFARTVYGTRASLVVGLGTTATVVVIGSVLGALAGYARGWVDAVVSRLTDVFFGVPVLLGALVVLTAFPAGVDTPAWRTVAQVVVALGAVGWTTVARLMRATVLEVAAADYVLAARSLGSGRWWVLRRHVLPNAVGPVLAWATMATGAFVAVEATLSFMGVGLQPPLYSWGLEIAEAQGYIRQSPHMVLFPSLFLSVTVLAFVLLGETVRTALDPRSQAAVSVRA